MGKNKKDSVNVTVKNKNSGWGSYINIGILMKKRK